MATRPRDMPGAVAFRADPDDPRHGTMNGYSNLGCRCDRCRAANAAYNVASRKRREGTLASDDPRHGKETTYFNYRCRCTKCKKVHSDKEAAYRDERKAGLR